MARLAEMAGGPLDEYMAAAVEGGTAAQAPLSALHAGTDALVDPAAGESARSA